MKILIIENEVYLSHSISQKLMDAGHFCTMCVTFDDSVMNYDYDVILLSTSVNGLCVRDIKKVYPDSIIILLASYVSNDTLLDLLNNGAKDYILKPFMIDQLIDKIEHYISYKNLQMKNDSYETYLKDMFSNIEFDANEFEIELPVFISTSIQKSIDAFAYKYAKHHGKQLEFISLSDKNAIEQIQDSSGDSLLYINGFHILNKSQRELFYSAIDSKEVIVSHTGKIEVTSFPTLKLSHNQSLFENDKILEIQEYVQYIIRTNQNRFTDTELSRRLGISRKSVWEKRRKYLIARD